MKDENLHIIYEALTGSRAYGTFNENSDFDYRGVAIPSKEYVYGLQNFEQKEYEGDRVIYSLKKFFKLASKSNPSILELLFMPESNVVKTTAIWDKISQHRYLFLSREIKYTYGGYAKQQLKRIKTHMKWNTANPNKPIWNCSDGPLYKREVIRTYTSLPNNLRRTDNNIDNMIEYYDKLDEYKHYESWLKNRNPKRLELEVKCGIDSKHAMHLIRLLQTCVDALNTGTIDVYRDNNEYLKSIRYGDIPYEEIIDLAETLENDIDSWYTMSGLPKKPDFKAIDNLLIEILEDFYS